MTTPQSRRRVPSIDTFARTVLGVVVLGAAVAGIFAGPADTHAPATTPVACAHASPASSC